MSRALRHGLVGVNGRRAGVIAETATGYAFTYDPIYLVDPSSPPVSLTLPKRSEPYVAERLFPAFCGLLAEGGLAEQQCRLHHLDERDTFGRVLATCFETIGAVSVIPVSGEVPAA